MISRVQNIKLGLSLSLTTAVLWALLPIALKGLLEEMDALTVTWYRFISAAIVIGFFLVFRLGLPKFYLLRGKLLLLMVICIFGLTLNYVCYLFGLQATSPSSTQVMIQLAPMLLLIGGLVFFRESFSRWQWIGFFLFLLGLGLFFNHRWAEIFGAMGDYTIGIIWVIAAAVLWAAYALTQKALLSYFSSFEIMFLIYCVGSLLLLPGSTPSLAFELNPINLGLLAFCCLNTLFAYGAFAESLAHWDASRVSAVLSLTPILTITFMHLARFIFPSYLEVEPLNVLSISGALLVVGGSCLTALSKSGPKEQA